MDLKWTNKSKWGATALTHRARATVNGVDWSLCIDKPYFRTWIVWGWAAGDLALYREAKTLSEAKDIATGCLEAILNGDRS